VKVSIAIPCDTSKNVVILRSNPLDKESFFFRDGVDRKVFDTYENNNGMDGW
jgi:hypothetical protein